MLWGLPMSSFLVLIVLPGLILIPMFYYSWLIKTGKREYCFTPDVSGNYTATVAVLDSCGLADTTSITYNVTTNTAPMAVDPSQTFELFQCDPDQVCYQFVANDNEGGTLVWTLASGPAGATVDATVVSTPFFDPARKRA